MNCDQSLNKDNSETYSQSYSHGKTSLVLGKQVDLAQIQFPITSKSIINSKNGNRSKYGMRRTSTLTKTLDALWRMKMNSSTKNETDNDHSVPVLFMRKLPTTTMSLSRKESVVVEQVLEERLLGEEENVRRPVAKRMLHNAIVHPPIAAELFGIPFLYSMFNPALFDYGAAMRHAARQQLCSEQTDLLETTASGYAAAAPQYVADFATMDYPLSSHINNNTEGVAGELENGNGRLERGVAEDWAMEERLLHGDGAATAVVWPTGSPRRFRRVPLWYPRTSHSQSRTARLHSCRLLAFPNFFLSTLCNSFYAVV
uniref:Uncharacterized protein n=1 Tax=Heterorhabditis bacteriophora TaxID=37862 RepID=A0A1I7XQ36_HETBA